MQAPTSRGMNYSCTIKHPVVRTPQPRVKLNTEEEILMFATEGTFCPGSRKEKLLDPSRPCSGSLRLNHECIYRFLVIENKNILEYPGTVVVHQIACLGSFFKFFQKAEEGEHIQKGIFVFQK